MPTQPPRDPADVRKQLGQVIRRMRLDAGISEEELADRAAISRDELRRLEGGVFDPSFDAMLMIASGLRVSLVTILEAVTTVEWSSAGQRAAIIIDGLPLATQELALRHLTGLCEKLK